MAAQPKFDLDTLLKVGYEFEPLKKVLEYLLNREKENSDQINKLGLNIDETNKNILVYVSGWLCIE